MTDVAALLQQAVAALSRRGHATYRLQLGPELGFDDVAALGAYLSALGVSEAYLSPCFRCGPGSSHGYDVTDHNAFNPEVGSHQSFDRMAAGLAGRGLGVIIDVVPNHMGIAGDANPWWVDILENGPSSPYAPFFDIDWAPTRAELRNKVLLPVLPDQYGRVLESQQLQLELFEGAFFVRYAGARLPVNPNSYAHILTHRIDALGERLGADHAHFRELRSILSAVEHLPDQTEQDLARVEERLREKEIIKRRLANLVKESTEVREFVDDNVRIFNGNPGEPSSFDLLDRLLSAQTYRLADWRVAGDEVNYRRFFDVSHLAAIRMERPEVFEASHKLILELVGEGTVTGLRIDHPDGLYAPGAYFRRLQEGAILKVARRLEPGLGAAEAEAMIAQYRRLASARPVPAAARPLWISAEKILAPEEPLPDWWLVAGTTGYDFLASVNGLFVDRKAWRQMTAVYARFVGAQSLMGNLSYAAKRLIMQVSMASEISQLGRHLDRISERNRHSRDFTLNSLIRALLEIIACFPVYRTYVGDDGFDVSARDHDYIERAVAEAKRRNPTVNVSVFDFVRNLLLLRDPPGADEAEWAERRHFVMRFQQTTGPVTAKGVEDTALYLYNRLVSLNEVGADPARYGESVGAFHEKNAQRLARWPESLTCSSTHDTKRGEDVRARINVLSEVPGPWAIQVRHWRMLGRRLKRVVDGHPAPDQNDEYLLYQALVGAWPVDESEDELALFTERVCRYMDKALKEAKRHTSWINPNAAYDTAVRDFITGLLAPNSQFLDAFRPFQRRVALYGVVNSLAQTVLKIAAPGIPDFYQGSELWDLALVDPDNRRPVDFVRRRALLDSLVTRIPPEPADLAPLCAELLQSWPDGRVKLYATHRALTLRRQRPRLFAAGGYQPLAATGEQAEHVIAFARVESGGGVVVAVPRLPARLTAFSGRLPLGDETWRDTWLALDASLAGAYRDRFTGRRIATEPRDGVPVLPAGALFGVFPVALLERDPR
ncbi:MAG TPA: malto-oligosyltrehalose synthase [Methylomirabilota bacterium]|jgi:(1->4)-alpha-D-glucan 1-alpha-D-glucosylmutase|nr:malto-oligosyltrehalose synthase [Methylomirabilota bacterium]